MKLVKLFCVFIICLLNYNCSNNKTGSNQILNISISDLSKVSNVKLSDIGIKQIQYIPLEANSNDLIPYIRSIKFSEESFYVDIAKTIFKFDNNGRFIAQIGNNGRGPSEYQFVNDFDVDENNKQVFISAGNEKKIYVYSSKDGTFIKTIQSPDSNIRFRIISNNILCYSYNFDGAVSNSFNLLDINGNLLKSYPNKYKFTPKGIPMVILNQNLFYKYNNQLYKKEAYSDTTYIFNDGNFIPKIVLNEGDKLMPVSAHEGLSMDYVRKNFNVQFNIFELSHIIYYEFQFDGSLYELIVNKETGGQLLTKQEGFINDIDGGPPVKLKSSIDDYTIISWINPIELKKYIESDTFIKSNVKNPNKKEELEKLAKSINNDDNPILLLLK